MKALRAALPAGKAVLQSGSLYTNPNYSQAKKGEGVKILNWTSREEVRVTLKDPSLAGEAIDAANRYFEFSGTPVPGFP
ncbi:MAG: SIMPL domain-containing protein [Dakarella massiliensis]